ncbi:hypothetical protein KUCAC02_017023 [Chaenocephalus aceratus]|nr:hypothetical protein KUCAC02_017023 [Chaenocephalus aceratus]
MALELKHEHMLAEAKKAAEERKRARSVGDTLQSPKRGCVGRGKPRGRRGGDTKAQLQKRIWRDSLTFFPHVLLLSLKALPHPGLFRSRKPQSAGEKQDHTTYNAF